MRVYLGSRVLLSLAVVAGLAGAASAAPPPGSTIGTVQLRATVSESLTVTISGGNSVNFVLAPNTAANNGSNTSTVNTAWSLQRGRRQVSVWAYFSSAAAALVPLTPANPAAIPSSAVKIQVNGAGGFNACTNATPFSAAASGLRVGTTFIRRRNRNGRRTDVLAYQIDTTVVPALPADTYRGVLNLQAQATP